jgi:uncharacterized protein YqjF (DUF2071 family)
MLTKHASPAGDREFAETPAFRAMFVADWVNVSFVHFAVSPGDLQLRIPFELDTFDGISYISLVAFTQRRLRPAIGGRIAEWLSTPLACHEFLNVRTYVRHRGERGIYFLAEWIPNRLAALIGPALYGLPYRVGRLQFNQSVEGDRFTVNVTGREGCVEFGGTIDKPRDFSVARDGSLAAFLIERYTAWTYHRRVVRRFRIQHEPWLQCSADVTLRRADLLQNLCGGWFDAPPIGAHFSPGVFNVAIGRPERCHSPQRKVTGTCTSG